VRKTSTLRSQTVIWFQFALFRSTILRSFTLGARASGEAVMRRLRSGVLLMVLLGSPADRRDVVPEPVGPHAIAFASFAPLNTDIFIAAADGSAAKPLLAHPDLDYNPSFSPDGQWIVFTSTRNGSADVFRVRRDGSGLERLTDHPSFDDQGALSPDGRRLAFVSSRSGQADIWILELASGSLRNLTNHPGGDFRPAWSPDGRRIAFSSDRHSQKPMFTFVLLQATEIHVVGVDGSGLQRVTSRQAVAGSPSWSSDGKRLVYYEASIADLQKIRSATRERGTTQIVSVDLITGDRDVLTSGPGEKWSPHWMASGRLGYVAREPEADGGVHFVPAAEGARGEMRSPSWSADGRWMVFHRDVDNQWPPARPWPSRDPSFRLQRTGVFPSYSPGGERFVVNDEKAGILHNRIVVMNADGSDRSVLFGDTQRSALAPAWSPDGARIAVGIGQFFQGVRGPSTADIAVMNVDGSGLRILTDGSTNYGLPSWSPDGRQVVFRRAGREHNGLLIADVATGALRTLTASAAHDNFPSWSPDGDRIAFTSDRDGDYEIYSIRTDGTELRRLTHSPGNDAHNAWSPDGKWIVFTSARGGFKDESALHPFNPQPYGDLYVMRADGSDIRILTDDQFEDGTPGWRPARRK
jgi:TolB protein